jgi:hypothetical protein
MRAHNSTIRLKQKPCKRCGLPKYIFSKGICKECATIEDTLARDEKETEKVIEKEDLSGLIEDADAIFSQFIRLKYASNDGVTGCFTCYARKHWTLMQNGHYIKRGHLFLRWDERNCRPQCQECNELKDGNIPEFTRRLESGNPGITEILTEEMRLVYKPTRDEIRQIIASYAPKVKELKTKLIPNVRQ